MYREQTRTYDIPVITQLHWSYNQLHCAKNDILSTLKSECNLNAHM